VPARQSDGTLDVDTANPALDRTDEHDIFGRKQAMGILTLNQDHVLIPND